MAGDWVKVHRCLMDSAVWADDWLVRLWIWCLLKANHSPAVWRGTNVARGQFVTGRNTASDELGVSPSKWYRGIMRLAELGNITVEANSVWTMITVCNYSTYQEREQSNRTADEQRLNSERTANEQPADSERTPVRRTRTQEDNTNSNQPPCSWKEDITIPFGWSADRTMEALERWVMFRLTQDGREPPGIQLSTLLLNKATERWTDEKFVLAVAKSIEWNAKTIRDPDNDHDKRKSAAKQKTAEPEAKPEPHWKPMPPIPDPPERRAANQAYNEAIAAGKTPEEALAASREAKNRVLAAQ